MCGGKEGVQVRCASRIVRRRGCTHCSSTERAIKHQERATKCQLMSIIWDCVQDTNPTRACAQREREGDTCVKESA